MARTTRTSVVRSGAHGDDAAARNCRCSRTSRGSTIGADVSRDVRPLERPLHPNQLLDTRARPLDVSVDNSSADDAKVRRLGSIGLPVLSIRIGRPGSAMSRLEASLTPLAQCHPAIGCFASVPHSLLSRVWVTHG
jgi:hypothetical protein